MARMFQEMKLNFVAGVLTLAGTCVLAGLFVDDRYAKASDMAVLAKTIDQRSRMVIQQSERSAAELRKQLLEDKIYELDLIPDNRKTDVERATVNRARSQLRDIQVKINQQESSR